MDRIDFGKLVLNGNTSLNLEDQIALEVLRRAVEFQSKPLFTINGIYQLPRFSGLQVPSEGSIPFGGYGILLKKFDGEEEYALFGRMMDLRGDSRITGNLTHTQIKKKPIETLNLTQEYLGGDCKGVMDYTFREENGIFVGEYSFRGPKPVKGRATCKLEFMYELGKNLSLIFKD